ncbi:MAG: hypothetical protein AB1374_02505 [Bacillota bacterium]
MAAKFSIGEAIEFGWKTMKSNLGFFVALLIIVAIIEMVPEVISEITRENLPAVALLADLLSFVVQMVIGMGVIKIALRFCDGEKAGFADLFSCLSLFFRYLFAGILYCLIVLAGTILLVVPGIIWGIQYQFFSYFIIDKKTGVIESLKRSSAITKGSRWNLFLFGLLLALINILGMLALLIGLFATVPTTMVANAYVYRKLAVQAEAAQAPAVSVIE